MTAPAEEAVAAVAQALGITPRACRKILEEEEATPAQAEEALRRIRRHTSAQISSPTLGRSRHLVG